MSDRVIGLLFALAGFLGLAGLAGVLMDGWFSFWRFLAFEGMIVVAFALVTSIVVGIQMLFEG
ncbi:MAG: hypothetical protein V4510_12465 [bacterium]